jgi:hypothetical protein
MGVNEFVWSIILIVWRYQNTSIHKDLVKIINVHFDDLSSLLDVENFLLEECDRDFLAQIFFCKGKVIR